jgi:hypothetical protein
LINYFEKSLTKLNANFNLMSLKQSCFCGMH